MSAGNVIGSRVVRVASFVAMLALSAPSAFGQGARKTGSYSASPVKDQRSWFQRRFKRVSFDEAMLVSHSPADICMAIRKSVSYSSDKTDRWMAADETWRCGKGDCEDFAVLVREMCNRLGLEVSIHLYFPAGRGGEGHAVAVGKWQGRYWVSSNGSYDEAGSLEEIGALVAREQGWNSDEVWSVILKSADVQRFVLRDRGAFSS